MYLDISTTVLTTNSAASSPGSPPERDEATETFGYATTQFLRDDEQPYVPAGVFDLGAEPQTFSDFEQRRIDMARNLEILLLPFASSGAAPGSPGDDGHDGMGDDGISPFFCPTYKTTLTNG